MVITGVANKKTSQTIDKSADAATQYSEVNFVVIGVNESSDNG